MATKKQCEAALQDLALRLDGVDGDVRRRHAPDRTLCCRITDLDVTYRAHLRGGTLTGITESPPDTDAQVRVTLTSDDLLALARGDVTFGRAWSTGRVRVDAGILDLVRLRAVVGLQPRS